VSSVRARSSRPPEPAAGAASQSGVGLAVRRSPYLFVEDISARYGVSTRWVHERTRVNEIPHRRLPGSRRCLFLEAELEAWEAGAVLEVRELDGGGRIVRPK
jgi:predicted DNA-binding transcriptional regulator AlpA